MVSSEAERTIAELAAAAVTNSLSSYGAGFKAFPPRAYDDPYVVGYLNAIILSVAREGLGVESSQRAHERIHTLACHELPKEPSDALLTGTEVFKRQRETSMAAENMTVRSTLLLCMGVILTLHLKF